MNRFSVVAHINGIRRLYRTNRYLTYASLKAPPPQTPKQTVTIYRFIEKRNTGPFIVQMGATSPPPLPPFRRPFSLPPPRAPLSTRPCTFVLCAFCVRRNRWTCTVRKMSWRRVNVLHACAHTITDWAGGRASVRKRERERELSSS
jgi:hypothetical protein